LTQRLAPLLDDLRASTRPTLVIVTADHGEGLGDHGEQSHGLFAYESTLRVPLILAQVVERSRATLSGSRSQGEVSNVSARHVDILPDDSRCRRTAAIAGIAGAIAAAGCRTRRAHAASFVLSKR
jgi:hypothetical protein